jgi:3-hydroxyisobutyrate dehydrogenase-like beta-hydroxyacid dehydrogenase
VMASGDAAAFVAAEPVLQAMAARCIAWGTRRGSRRQSK